VPCPFCDLDAPLTHESELVVAFRDRFPVTEGHTLVIPRRHVETYFDANAFEKAELWRAVDAVKIALDAEFRPQAYNVGFNAGRAAGQTVMHLHIHVIPRREGDVEDPQGGVRGVIPAKQKYGNAAGGADPARVLPVSDAGLAPRYSGPTLASSRAGAELAARFAAPHGRALILGADDDPLLPHLRAHLAAALEVDIAVAFVLQKGLRLVLEPLQQLLERGGRLRFLTGDYLGGTEPEALWQLLDLAEAFEGRALLRMYETRKRSFHPKAYLLVEPGGGGTVVVGSSNLSETALKRGVEWNFRTSKATGAALESAVSAFEALFDGPETVQLSAKWIEDYTARRPRRQFVSGAALGAAEPEEVEEEPVEKPQPTRIQLTALDALADTRADGYQSGLVVLATGLGKTWLAAFDTLQPEFKRILFMAHREEILRQAHQTFRQVHPHARLGYYHGGEKTPDADILFASVQTLSRDAHLASFAKDHFDYIVVDEFHHVDADTYRKVLSHFEPQFLLGLTATPERTDGGNLLAQCGENLVHSVNLFEGIEQESLAPFDYFGIPDSVDYQNIPWRRLSEEQLGELVATEHRAQNALQQLEKHGGKRILTFCVSISHAEHSRQFFEQHGYRVVTVHSGPNSAPREQAVEQLEAGTLDMIVTVDVFNEGVDIPSVDTVLMLRPTESRVIWLQQLGRGLRRHTPDKRLKVVDYVGNHSTFVEHLRTLMRLELAGRFELRGRLSELRAAGGAAELPSGCSVTYELEALANLDKAIPVTTKGAEFEQWARAFNEEFGRRPRAVEAYHAGHDPNALPKSLSPFFQGMSSLKLLSAAEEKVVADAALSEFLAGVQGTSMSKSYKMVLLLAWIQLGGFPGAVQFEALVDGFRHVASRSGPVALDVSVDLDDRAKLRQLLSKQPIKFLTGSESGLGHSLRFENGTLASVVQPALELTSFFAAMTEELAEWKLAAYLHRNRARRLTRVVEADGQELDASFTSEKVDGGFAVILESRGGTAGTKSARNTQYSQGLALLLARLAEMDATLVAADLATREVEHPLELKRFSLPISLKDVSELKTLQSDIQRAQGNNSTRRIRIVVTGVRIIDVRDFQKRLSGR
jgi:superfamily II DNA or RNA helicase/diadenosine tetraphosphate (Ap4A) HIT family hydrolase